MTLITHKLLFDKNAEFFLSTILSSFQRPVLTFLVPTTTPEFDINLISVYTKTNLHKKVLI
ncbi:hypothetical protein WICANDRAFT_84800 [Wickerhamomyces anomalus NRRL Y-366-8]|uniref:Uncharacterized protein n=1 Tax=Wickerhamomyces anomalus (strain ATCC 58044 / CBS 1984 / NCYC 433 / NRRL Y-366-8) TaxID=683960 RepID=A0A1E3P183_WICAA|nr:uncharacterized protein WICANDRAFT_84800 [Wickerhamomyces anomalus NRRL Y-366-8]ODQ59165.1 hypothetical protein WICANDRAFT_84800 [Wickerhamomyces anomalus NRRL Y-366-8]